MAQDKTEDKPRDMDRLTGFAERHDGLVTVSEILDCGLSRSWACARVDSGLWQRLHRGVYATFPHEPTWTQRATAGLMLAGGRAALCRRSAGYLHGLLPDAPRIIEITLPHHLRIEPSAGLSLHRRRRGFAVVGNPRRTNLVTTVVDLVDAARSQTEVLDLLTAGVRLGARPRPLLAEATARRYLGNRDHLVAMLTEYREGLESPLEAQYDRNVLRAHGLPSPTRQARQRVRGYWIRSDCWFEGLGLRVELDGELAHPGKATEADVLRDNDTLLTRDEITLRYRWTHTLSGACVTAAQTAFGLSKGGFGGEPQACRPGCTAAAEFQVLQAQSKG